MESKCHQCGLCCRLFPVPLSEEEYRSGEYKTIYGSKNKDNDFREVVTVGANLLAQKKDGSCVYLVNNRCLVHKKRPRVCRPFFCTSKEKKFQKMIKMVKKARPGTSPCF